MAIFNSHVSILTMVINIYETQKIRRSHFRWSQVKQSAFAHFCGGESLEAHFRNAHDMASWPLHIAAWPRYSVT